MQARWQGSNIFKVLKKENPTNLVLYPVKIFFQNKVKIKTVSDIQKVKVHHHRPILPKIRDIL